MAKNENNSHAFIRKMVENIKQTKDAQGPDDTKMNEKLYTVCDVAMNIIMSKSTTYSLESPKDPVLPARFFTQPDKVTTWSLFVGVDMECVLARHWAVGR